MLKQVRRLCRISTNMNAMLSNELTQSQDKPREKCAPVYFFRPPRRGNQEKEEEDKKLNVMLQQFNVKFSTSKDI